uniref:Adenosine 3'-phospho 5'-phosphosulfate transporter 1 n=1 Tax=Echinostoma caproni TaxID=27848 RepID=A0A183AY97_9TREM
LGGILSLLYVHLTSLFSRNMKLSSNSYVLHAHFVWSRSPPQPSTRCQERIMTRDYNGQMFGHSQFLVFCNRVITLIIVLPIHWLRLGVRSPFFEFSFASVSNIVSSWCQYEALKYVTFPTQVSGLIESAVLSVLFFSFQGVCVCNGFCCSYESLHFFHFSFILGKTFAFISVHG